MRSDEIRRTFTAFFEEREHLLLPSASLIPLELDPSALFTVAGMHPLKPYFLGAERPPRDRLTTCQKTFRTADIEIIGTTTSHLTFFEMLGNFSLGDYFKAGAARFAWELSTEGFGLPAQDIWITVFGGDEELGVGPDEEAIEAWMEIGVPRERIVECPRSENFWQMGPTGPCGPCSELYLDRGVELGKPDDLPGGDNERFLEYWNLVFMQFDQNPENKLTPLPANNIDTGLGLNRMAAILQDKQSVFETDQFAPLIALGEELSGRRYGDDFNTDRALRILADHGRAMTFLIGDGCVPSNEERGYVLRRIMRRAILQGRSTLGLEPGFLERYADRVTELMGREYAELVQHRESIHTWLADEEESFGRTLQAGSKLLDELIERARESGAEGISAADAFLLHDTHGFPFDLTLELVAAHSLGVDEQGFEALMEDQRRRARAGAGRTREGEAERLRAVALSADAGFTTEFKGYEATALETTVGAVARENGRLLVKLLESPFYAAGGGQVADSGWVECEHGECLARVQDVLRLGDDQVVALVTERGPELHPGERVEARVDRPTRHATACNHTATHLLHAALRARLGGHVRQAGSYVGPDKLRFDFTHASALAKEDLAEVERQVNSWILGSHQVRWLTTTLNEARALGAMALFGEKYGDVVRMVEVGDGSFSRELCGGTHVRNTAEIGLFKIVSESSSAANVRRVEALTGPVVVALMQAHDRALADAAGALRVPPERVPGAVAELRARVKELERTARSEPGDELDVDALVAQTEDILGACILALVVPSLDGQTLLELLDRLRARLPESAIVLGSSTGGKVDLLVGVPPSLVARGVRAGEIVKVAAATVGGGGGGRDTLARAGGREPAKLPDAIAAARAAIEAALS
jgi:alanyl-tRNA synthetase